MKFDKLIEQILTEMPISLYDTPEMKSQFPDVPAMTPEDRKASKQRIIDHLKTEGPRYYNILDKGESSPQDVLMVLSQGGITYKQIFNDLAEDIINILFPNGYNPARTGAEAKDITLGSKDNMRPDTAPSGKAARLDVLVKQYANEKGIPNKGLSFAYSGHTLRRLYTLLTSDMEAGKQGDEYEGVKRYHTNLIKRNYKHSTQGRGGSKSVDTDTPVDLGIHDSARERQEFGEAYLMEMPFRINPTALNLYKKNAEDLFIEKVKTSLLQNKHKHIGNQLNTRGAPTYHASKVASGIVGKQPEDLTTEEYDPILESYLRVIYRKVFGDNAYTDAADEGALRVQIEKVVRESIDLIAKEIQVKTGVSDEQIDEVLETLNMVSADVKYFARIVQLAAREAGLLKKESIQAYFEAAEQGPGDEDEDEDGEEEDDDTESSDYAYEHGLLDDGGDKEPETSENEVETTADNTAASLDSAGVDIAQTFLRSLDAVFDELESEGDFEDNEEEFNSHQDEEDLRSEIGGRGLIARDNQEDDDGRFTDWHQSRIDRGYDEDEDEDSEEDEE